MESRLSTNEKPSDSEIAVKTQALVGEKCESSHLDEPQSSLFSVSANDQIPQNKMSLRNEASVEEICGSSPSGNAQLLPQHSSENELSPECVGSRALMEKNCKNSPLDNVGLAPFPVSGSVNEKIQENATSIRVKSSSEKNCNSSNLQSVLVCDSTLCLRSDDVGCHVRDSIEKNSKEEVPPTVSAPTKSTEKGERRTSKYHGVTRHFWTGKFEAHLWDNSFIQEGHRRKGKQVFLGQYEIEEKAAQAYDVAALKYWGTGASPKLNFPITMYKKELEEMKNMSRDEFILCIKRKSCFKRGSSIYRGVTRHGNGRWQARISGVPCKKGLHLGTFSSEEEAAKAYDIAAVKLRGKTAFTNFDITNYCQGALEESEGQSQPKRLKNSKAAASTTIDLELYPQTDVPVISP